MYLVRKQQCGSDGEPLGLRACFIALLVAVLVFSPLRAIARFPSDLWLARTAKTRPVAVSAYFHTLRTAPTIVDGVTLDEYVLGFLPTACKWVSVRYILFSHVLAGRSALFWYDDAKESPEDWHKGFYGLAGLQMPPAVVAKAAGVAAGTASDYRLESFPSKGMDVHLGEEGEEGETQERRTFRDEVLPETLLEMDAVLQTWLPPVLLQKFRVGLP